jgi:hypothetical protein
MNGGYGETLSGTDELRIGEILRVLARQKLLITAVTLLVTLAAFAWIATRQPRYEARATLLLEKEEGGVLSELASLASEPAAEAEIALIQSRSLAEVTCAPPASFRPKSLLYEATEPDFDPFAMPNEDERAVYEAARNGGGGCDAGAAVVGLAQAIERHGRSSFRDRDSAIHRRGGGDTDIARVAGAYDHNAGPGERQGVAADRGGPADDAVDRRESGRGGRVKRNRGSSEDLI